MNLFDDLNEENYIMFALKHYDNIQCTSIEEFHEDLNKIKYVKRLLNRFLETGELKTNLILNHLIVIYNVFENSAATRMLFFKVEKKFYSILKPFLIFLDRLPENIRGISGEDILTNHIPLNETTIKELRKIYPNK
jgi:hypothetical protein|tara:strand:+ start:583 stop:990 length:408 start_codon:yes stop_codon:yes gene_type:complete